MANQGDLMGIFSNLISAQKPITLYNTYRGLPFSYDADILAVEQGSVITRVDRHQAVSMASEGRTHLYDRSLPEVIRANVVGVDFKTKQATLNEFIGVGDAVGKRASVRVQPDESLEAEIYDGRRRIRGRIADISDSGMCIFTFATDMYGLSFRIGWEVYIDFMPPNSDTMVRFLGVITNINYHDGSYLHRLGLKIYPNPEIKPLLEEYVVKQQQVILAEMEQTFQLMSQEDSKQG
jgi:hypothetical protein